MLAAVCACLLPFLPAGEEPLPVMVPTPVSWPAGAHSLAAILERLSADGNTTVVSLGIDDTRRVTLPAFVGTYWEAVFVVCRSFDLAPAPPPPPSVTGDPDQEFLGIGSESPGSVTTDAAVEPTCGPVVLAALPLAATPYAGRASGMLLFDPVEVINHGSRRLTGTDTWVELRHRLRCEPRISRAELEEVTVTWTMATADGRALVFGGPTDQLTVSGGFARPPGRPPDQPPWLPPPPALTGVSGPVATDQCLLVRGVRPGDRVLRLQGVAAATVVRPWQHQRRLTTDTPVIEEIEGERYELVLFPTLAADRRRLDQSSRLTITHRGVSRLQEPPVVTVQDAAGNILTGQGSGSGGGSGMSQVYHYRFLRVTAGEHRISLTGRHRLGGVQFGFTGEMELP
jgi:hypothetical protein